MRVLITGACGFVGFRVASFLAATHPHWELIGVDNLIRPGSETNRSPLTSLGVRFLHDDLRDRDAVMRWPQADWVIDCAANASVLAGTANHASSQSIMDHNLVGTIHILEYCRQHQAGMLLLSSSRVYSIDAMQAIPLRDAGDRYELDASPPDLPAGLSPRGLTESFSTQAPISLYGATKLASEVLAQEYALAFGFPLWINRCGLLAGAGQFGRPDQGIVTYWLHAYRYRKQLKYIGFGGRGIQVRDCLHPDDLARLIVLQLQRPPAKDQRVVCNVSGGLPSAFSLRELTQWCERRWLPPGERSQVALSSDPHPRPFDCPWVVLDAAPAQRMWNWSPERDLDSILNEIAEHAERHAEWLELSQA
jgi:CDP-paratose 2-epimerase